MLTDNSSIDDLPVEIQTKIADMVVNPLAISHSCFRFYTITKERREEKALTAQML